MIIIYPKYVLAGNQPLIINGSVIFHALLLRCMNKFHSQVYCYIVILMNAYQYLYVRTFKMMMDIRGTMNISCWESNLSAQ